MTQNSDPIQECASEVPGDIRRALTGLAGEQQLGTVVYLLKHGEQSFAELQEGLDVHQQTLTNALNKLQEGGIVVCEDVSDRNSSYNTQYQVTEFGKRVLDKLFDSIQPKERRNNVQMAETDAWVKNAPEDGPYLVTNPQTRSSSGMMLLDSETSPRNHYAEAD